MTAKALRGVLGTTVILMLCSSGVLLADDPPNSLANSEQARSLLQERLQVLIEIANLQRKSYESGQVQLAMVLTAEADVLTGRLELAQDQTERIAILEAMLENARQLEQVVERLSQAHEVSSVDALKAKAFRLRLQADWLRARAALK